LLFWPERAAKSHLQRHTTKDWGRETRTIWLPNLST
jgi:hypothetical protein